MPRSGDDCDKHKDAGAASSRRSGTRVERFFFFFPCCVQEETVAKGAGTRLSGSIMRHVDDKREEEAFFAFGGVKCNFSIDLLPRPRRAKLSVANLTRVIWPRACRHRSRQDGGGDAPALTIQLRTRRRAADGWLTSGS